MPPPTVTNGTSMIGIPASTSICSVQKSLPMSWSLRSPGWGALGGWPCCGAIVLSLTRVFRPLTGRSHFFGTALSVSTGPRAAGDVLERPPAGARCEAANGGGQGVLSSGGAEAALPRRVLLAGRPQVPAVEIGPQRVEEDQLRVGRLPEHEVARAVLPRAADEQVDVGQV